MPIRFAAFLAVIAIVLLGLPMTAGAADKGYEAFQRQDYAGAIKHWLPRAQSGDVEMQYYVGVSYEMAVDPPRAAEWYAKAVRGNHGDALERLILVAFRQGHTDQTAPIVLATLLDRAKDGNSAAIYDLGRYQEARANWYQRVNEEDSLDNADLQDAWAFYTLAAEQGQEVAADQAARIYASIKSAAGQDHARARLEHWRARLVK